MAYLDHIAICTRHDLSHFVPFSVGGVDVGWIWPKLADEAAATSGYFLRDPDGLALDPRLDEFNSRSAALAEASEDMSERGLMPRLRGEFYSVAPGFMTQPLAQIDRGVVQAFGVRAYGVHVNGFVRRPDGIDMWIGRRAPTQILCPNMLDNMVAGGQPIGLTPFDNVVKEAHEEADVPEAIARTAKPVATVRYNMEVPDGLRQDTMFCYDLELPADFTPKNTDGEVAEFLLLPAEEVKAIVRDTFDFKFNCNLVIMDFLIRHKLLTEGEADIAAIRKGMGQGIV